MKTAPTPSPVLHRGASNRPDKPTARPPGKSYESTLPFDDQRVGAAAVYCSDGRFGEQMDEFLHQSLGMPRYDRVAVPGGAACLAGHMMVYHEAAALDRQLSFLITSHALTKVVLIAHENCGFYKGLWIGTTPLEQQQASDLQKAADQIRSHHPRVEVDAYFARKVDGKVRFEKWNVSAVRQCSREGGSTAFSSPAILPD